MVKVVVVVQLLVGDGGRKRTFTLVVVGDDGKKRTGTWIRTIVIQVGQGATSNMSRSRLRCCGGRSRCRYASRNASGKGKSRFRGRSHSHPLNFRFRFFVEVVAGRGRRRTTQRKTLGTDAELTKLTHKVDVEIARSVQTGSRACTCLVHMSHCTRRLVFHPAVRLSGRHFSAACSAAAHCCVCFCQSKHGRKSCKGSTKAGSSTAGRLSLSLSLLHL